MTDDIISQESSVIEKPVRTLQQMQIEFHQMCIRMGELSYEIYANEKAVEQNQKAIEQIELVIAQKKEDLCKMKGQVHTLNLEAAAVKQKEEAAQQVEALCLDAK